MTLSSITRRRRRSGRSIGRAITTTSYQCVNSHRPRCFANTRRTTKSTAKSTQVPTITTSVTMPPAPTGFTRTETA